MRNFSPAQYQEFQRAIQLLIESDNEIDLFEYVLQKIVLRRSGNLPRYRVLEQSGHTNDRVFTVGVFERDFLLGMGKASSIKEAGRLAAREALEMMTER